MHVEKSCTLPLNTICFISSFIKSLDTHIKENWYESVQLKALNLESLEMRN